MLFAAEKETILREAAGKRFDGIFLIEEAESDEKYCLVTKIGQPVYLGIGERYLRLEPEKFTLTAAWKDLSANVMHTQMLATGTIEAIHAFPMRPETPVEAIRVFLSTGESVMIRVCGGKIGALIVK